MEIGWDDMYGGELHRTTTITDIYGKREVLSAYYGFERGEAKPLDQHCWYRLPSLKSDQEARGSQSPCRSAWHRTDFLRYTR